MKSRKPKTFANLVWVKDKNGIKYGISIAILQPDSGRLTSLICRAVSKTISKPVSLRRAIVVKLATFFFFFFFLVLSRNAWSRLYDLVQSSSVYRCPPPRNLSSGGEGNRKLLRALPVSFPTNDPTFLLIHFSVAGWIGTRNGESRKLERGNEIDPSQVGIVLFIYFFGWRENAAHRRSRLQFRSFNLTSRVHWLRPKC